MVYLVGAGPGDPGLITVKGREVLRRAQVVVYDQLASPELLQEAPADAEIIYVGKKAGAHALPQEGINQLLVDKARAGLRVVRLKGGDPFVFGRGGEEALALANVGLPFEIVPGVTAAVAVPAYAGIPVTHRGLASLVTFITGHEDPTKEASAIPWDVLAQTQGTLVFLMGVKNLADNCRRLLAGGRVPTTPAAVIEKGATLQQRTVTGVLENIAARAQAAAIKPPAILVVGEAVSLRESLTWWETRPLWGKTAVVTRTREQASALSALLTAAGARCLEAPTIEIGPPDDGAPLDQALENLPRYQWLVFTSANGVTAFLTRLGERGKDVRALGGLKIAAIGPATAQALEARGLKADVVPAQFKAEDLLAALSPQVSPGDKVLLARAQIAREVLPQGLVRLGVEVDVVPVYQARQVTEIPPAAQAAFEQGKVDLLTFTSSATVHNFALLVGKDRFQTLAQNAVVAAIGPITGATLQEYGVTPQVQPEDFTISALSRAIVEYFMSQQC
ncbi:MAG: uroporphyrinogen-III C-methyltransferase [Deltaproteobacteria bacterium]|nr:MAG: uroporphyrinogen-III C-methyltransferase [Deltaproteobacteria bacterium]